MGKFTQSIMMKEVGGSLPICIPFFFLLNIGLIMQ